MRPSATLAEVGQGGGASAFLSQVREHRGSCTGAGHPQTIGGPWKVGVPGISRDCVRF